MSLLRHARSAPDLRTALFVVLGGLSVVGAVGCSVRLPDGVFACQDSPECPPTQRCYAGRCLSAPPIGMDATGGQTVMVGTRAGQPSIVGPSAGASGGGGNGVASGSGSGGSTTGDGGAVAGSVPNAGGGGTVACACSTNDACCGGCLTKNEAGACVSDSRDCTDDVCRAGQCVHDIKRGFCLIGGACFSDAQNNPSNACQRCDAVAHPNMWAPQPSAAACDDGLYCNGIDSCDGAGSCSKHAGDPCPSNDSCTHCDEHSKSCVTSRTATWYDSASNFLWDVAPAEATDWQPAVDNCAALTLCGHADWRLPTIGELRTLIRGCPANQTGGSCGVTDSCLTSSCNTGCGQCTNSAGSYWPPAFTGNSGNTWSSSTRSDDPSTAWIVYFAGGYVTHINKRSTSAADAGGSHCVRTGPL